MDWPTERRQIQECADEQLIRWYKELPQAHKPQERAVMTWIKMELEERGLKVTWP